MALHQDKAREAGRYRKLYPRIWRHQRFRALKPAARELALYLLTGPQTNAIGLFSLSLGAAAEDLGIGHETLVERFADVRQAFGWQYDADARVIFIQSWWRWNRPENANVLRGNMKALSELPQTALSEAFALNIRTLPETLHETFVECCRERLGQPSPIQEQEAGASQEQDQEHEQAGRQDSAWKPAGAAPMRLATKAGSDEELMPVAREVLKLTNGSIDHLVDTLLNIKPKAMACSRSRAIAVMNSALLERRQLAGAR